MPLEKKCGRTTFFIFFCGSTIFWNRTCGSTKCTFGWTQHFVVLSHPWWSFTVEIRSAKSSLEQLDFLSNAHRSEVNLLCKVAAKHCRRGWGPSGQGSEACWARCARIRHHASNRTIWEWAPRLHRDPTAQGTFDLHFFGWILVYWHRVCDTCLRLSVVRNICIEDPQTGVEDCLKRFCVWLQMSHL